MSYRSAHHPLEVHVKRMERAGQLQPYRYSMVMDSDTASEWRSILRLVESPRAPGSRMVGRL